MWERKGVWKPLGSYWLLAMIIKKKSYVYLFLSNIQSCKEWICIDLEMLTSNMSIVRYASVL